MSSIKGVMLFPLDAESYRHHVAHNTFLTMVNSGTQTPDSRLKSPLASTSRWSPARHCGRGHDMSRSALNLDGISNLSLIGLWRLP